MKKTLISIFVFAFAVAAQARSPIYPSQEFTLPADLFKTGLRNQVSGPGFKGPIEILQDQYTGEVTVFIDDNNCSEEGICTQMAPRMYPATAQLVSVNGGEETYVILPNDPRIKFAPMYMLVDRTTLGADYDVNLKWLGQNYKMSAYKWMAKSTGAITCEPHTGISLEEQARELRKNHIRFMGANKAYTGTVQPMVCGIEDLSSLNAFLVDLNDILMVQALGFENLDLYPHGGF